MPSQISDSLRQKTTERADHCCEYYLFPQSMALHKHEIDHIVPIQHGGETSEDNLALSCMRCNRYKGPNIGSFDQETGQLVPFYHPRKNQWTSHFTLVGAIVQPITAEAKVTVRF